MTDRYMLDTVANPINGSVPPLPSEVTVPGTATKVPIALEAGYINGRYEWKSRKPDVEIDVIGDAPQAHVADCETGDLPVGATPDWAKRHNALNPPFPAVIYCNRSSLTPVFNAMDAAGLKIARDFYTWIATLDGTRSVPDMTGVVAVQAYGAAELGFNADMSIVYNDSFPHGSHPPVRNVVPAGNTLSLDKIVENRNGYLPTIIELSRANLNAANLATFNAYLDYDAALFASAKIHATIAEGTVYYTVN